MIKTILATWFLIQTYSVDGDKHNYLVEIPQKQLYVSLSLDEPLSYGENQWIKLKMNAECDIIKEPYMGAGTKMFDIVSYICTGESVEELKCTEQNSFVVGGIRHC